MARTCVYQRCLDAILTGVTCGTQTLSREIVLKAEPPDTDYENFDDASSGIGTTAAGSENPAPQEETTVNMDTEQIRTEECTNISVEGTVKKEPESPIKQSLRKRAASSDATNVVNQNSPKRRRASLPPIEICKAILEEPMTENPQIQIVPDAANDKTNSDALSKEKKIHKNIQCDVCPMKFRRKLDYLAHQFRYKKQVPVEYICPTCKRWFPTLQNIQRHGKCRVDITNHNLVCNFCEKLFDSPYRLESHLYHLHGEYINTGATSFITLNDNTRIILSNNFEKKSTANVQQTDSVVQRDTEITEAPSSNPTIAQKSSTETGNPNKEAPETSNHENSEKNVETVDASEPNQRNNQRADAVDEAGDNSEQLKLTTLAENSLPKTPDTVTKTPVGNVTPGNNGSTTGTKPTERTSTPRKMKQLTLMEFLQLSSKKKREAATPTKSAKPQEEQSALTTPQRPNSCTNVRTALFQRENQENEVPLNNAKKPFVRIHADTELLMSLLSNCSTIKTEPVDTDETFNDSLIPYRFRQTTRLSRSNPQVNSRPGRRSEKNRGSGVARQGEKFRKGGTIECKKCYIPLVRCDAKSKGNVGAAAGKVVAAVSTPDKNNRRTAPENKKNSVCSPLKHVEIPLVRLDNNFDRVNVAPGTANAVTPSDKPVSRVLSQSCDFFACKVCKKTFSMKENLREHMKLFHVVYMSSICDAQYSSRYRLLRHYLREHMMFKKDGCCICHESFADTSTLKRHVLQHCTKTILPQKDTFSIDVEVKCNAFRKHYKCSSCGKKFWFKSGLREHQEAAHPRPEEPRVEGNAVQSEDKGIEKEPGNPAASSVPEQAESDSLFNGNAEVVFLKSNVDPSDIDDSNRSTVNNLESEELQDDKEIEDVTVAPSPVEVLDPEKATYPCVTCGKQFRTFRNLCLHQRSYSQPASAQCRICGTAFTSKRLLQNHIAATHTTLEISLGYKFHCQFCNQGFVKKSNLRAHEMHFHPQQLRMTPVQAWFDSEQVWNLSTICSVCNLMFENHDHFREHNRYYYKGSVFMCTFCCKSFQGLYMLDHHNKLTHYPEETRNSYPYTCHICNEGFNLESHFHAHKLHVHPVEEFGSPMLIV